MAEPAPLRTISEQTPLEEAVRPPNYRHLLDLWHQRETDPEAPPPSNPDLDSPPPATEDVPERLGPRETFALIRKQRSSMINLNNYVKMHTEADAQAAAQRQPKAFKIPRDRSNLTLATVQALAQEMKDFGGNPRKLKEILPYSELKRLLKHARAAFESCPNVLTLRLPEYASIFVIGDTHGQFFDVLGIVNRHGWPDSHKWYLFNGDFVDRGAWGVENIILIYALKVLYPQFVHLTRGNHETTYCSQVYGFYQECIVKYSLEIFLTIQATFEWLPFAAVVVPDKECGCDVCNVTMTLKPGDVTTFFLDEHCKVSHGAGVVVLHGGLFRLTQDSNLMGTLRDLMLIERGSPDPQGDMVEDVLWSDPNLEPGLKKNKTRGCGTVFGPEITEQFLSLHGLSLLVRSHEGPDARKKRPHMKNNMMKGFAIDHTDKNQNPVVVTLFSAPDYPQGPKSMKNEGSVMEIRFRVFGPNALPMVRSQSEVAPPPNPGPLNATSEPIPLSPRAPYRSRSVSGNPGQPAGLLPTPSPPSSSTNIAVPLPSAASPPGVSPALIAATLASPRYIASQAQSPSPSSSGKDRGASLQVPAFADQSILPSSSSPNASPRPAAGHVTFAPPPSASSPAKATPPTPELKSRTASDAKEPDAFDDHLSSFVITTRCLCCEPSTAAPRAGLTHSQSSSKLTLRHREDNKEKKSKWRLWKTRKEKLAEQQEAEVLRLAAEAAAAAAKKGDKIVCPYQVQVVVEFFSFGAQPRPRCASYFFEEDADLTDREDNK